MTRRLRATLVLVSTLACGAEPQPPARNVFSPAPVARSAPCPEPSEPSAPSAPSIATATLPSPRLEKEPIQFDDESYTVWGASYYLRSRHHRAEVTREAIRVTGYITKTNLPDAPACAVHRAGKADPDGCRANIPAFWLGDRPDAPESEAIRVLGFASNYAQVYEAMLLMDRGKPGERYLDTFWGVAAPNPLPARGAKVRVQGRYGTTFNKATTGTETDVAMGILTYEEMITLERGRDLATLPGLKRKP